MVDPTSGRQYLLFGCARRGCDRVNTDYQAFGTRRHSYCLGHIPWWVLAIIRLRGTGG